MKTIIGIVLIIAGGIIFFQGLSRKDSLAGQAASAGTNIANAVDGGAGGPGGGRGGGGKQVYKKN